MDSKNAMAQIFSECSNDIKCVADFSKNLNPGFRLSDDSSFPIINIDDFVQNYGKKQYYMPL